MLYPLKFQTIYKEKIWGGDKVKRLLNKDFSPLKNCGETWEIAAVEPDCSVVSNGFLAGNTLAELVEIYMGDLVGESVFDAYGLDFPLLIKFIDAKDDLSIQVHPDDVLAEKLHHANGKTEMWYVIDAEQDAKLNIGFSTHITRPMLEEHIEKGTLEQVLNFVSVQADDAAFIPAGKVHAIGKGILLAEIQQSSDVTYRLYDYNRKDEQGNYRKLHLKQAYEAIHYNDADNSLIRRPCKKNTTDNLVKNPYFVCNRLVFDQNVEKIYEGIDSFVIYICLEGTINIQYSEGEETLSKGECLLIPACIDSVRLCPCSCSKLLEVYCPACG
ncbi:MAG: class I mannose-6-phosphate isomerase [Lentimicrobiaceae bacterium]|nr:class I mannose-6-phosphate isomerase [Lentimicrobiaceae bacterium]